MAGVKMELDDASNDQSTVISPSSFGMRRKSQTSNPPSSVVETESSSSSSSSIRLNVGGTIFATSPHTFVRFPECWLNQTLANAARSQTPVFLDRDGLLFRHVLNFCRSKELLLPKSFGDLEALRKEAIYFNLTSVASTRFISFHLSLFTLHTEHSI